MRLREFVTRADPVEWRLSSDSRLVKACLDGDEAAWAALIHKYKALIYSVPRRYGASAEDASDIFQAVCLELYSELPRLRRAGAVRSWLVSVTVHQSFHWKRRQRRALAREHVAFDEATLAGTWEPQPAAMMRVEREQQVRDAVARLPKRCESLIRMLFFEHPPVPYREIAGRMGLADGSIGFMRARCLKRLRCLLPERELARDDA